MFVVNDGQFSTMLTVKVYYATVAVLMAYNIVINDNETYCSARTWIGAYQTILFLAPTGAQEMLMLVRPSVRPFIRSKFV